MNQILCVLSHLLVMYKEGEVSLISLIQGHKLPFCICQMMVRSLCYVFQQIPSSGSAQPVLATCVCCMSEWTHQVFKPEGNQWPSSKSGENLERIRTSVEAWWQNTVDDCFYMTTLSITHWPYSVCQGPFSILAVLSGSIVWIVYLNVRGHFYLF